ncbi:MAG: hypothetical protein ACKPEQ_02475, partial [Dolichospermum sp.]
MSNLLNIIFLEVRRKMNKILEINEERLILKAHSDSVTAIAFTPDGKTVISGSGD